MEIEFVVKVNVPDGENCSEEDDNLGCGCDCLIIKEGRYGGPNDTTLHCRYVRNVYPKSDDELGDNEYGVAKHVLCPNPYT